MPPTPAGTQRVLLLGQGGQPWHGPGRVPELFGERVTGAGLRVLLPAPALPRGFSQQAIKLIKTSPGFPGPGASREGEGKCCRAPGTDEATRGRQLPVWVRRWHGWVTAAPGVAPEGHPVPGRP